MELFTILGIAVGLAMDAFAVSIAASVALRGATFRQTFRFAFHFGLFQFLMPIVGWMAGATLERWISGWDHWIAFGLLSAIGVKGILSALGRKPDEAPKSDPTRGISLVVLSFATSMDALAVGFSFAMLRVEIIYPCAIIGLVAAAFTTLGIQIGGRLGRSFGKPVEILGGAILIAIGLSLLARHLV